MGFRKVETHMPNACEPSPKIIELTFLFNTPPQSQVVASCSTLCLDRIKCAQPTSLETAEVTMHSAGSNVTGMVDVRDQAEKLKLIESALRLSTLTKNSARDK